MSEYIFLKGKAKWVSHDKINEWGKWTMVLYPDEASITLIRDLQAQGTKNVIKKDDDGYNVRLARPHEFKFNGRIKGMSPPLVLDGSQPLPGGGYAPLINTPIGNGSDCTVKMEVYEHRVPNSPGKKAKAMRWESIRIDNLIPFKKADFTPEEAVSADGFEDQKGFF